MAARSDPVSFGHFFRRYTKTWMHAVAAAGLTAFGALTFVHRGFVVLAIASYVVPPIVLYLSRRRSGSVTPDGVSSPTDAALDRQSESDAREDAEAAFATEREPASEGSASGRPAPGAADEEPDTEPRWTVVDSPTDATLFDVAATDGVAVAVGTGGVVLEATVDGWEVLVEDGPAAQGQNLRGVDATADGAVAWIAGDGGAVGRIELDSGRHTDHSAPEGRTDNLAGIAVAGARGDETVLLIDGSGAVQRGRYRDGDLVWDEPVTPGSGSSLSGVDLVDASVGYCCDTNGGVFETVDGGRAFETVGLDGADGTLTGIAAGGRGDCHACTDAGVVYRYDGSRWTPERVDDGALTGIARRDGRLVACGERGAIYDRAESTADWKRHGTGASGALAGVAIGSGWAAAVGTDGTVVERR